MITLDKYWKQRDVCYATQCTQEIRDNAVRTVSLVNKMLDMVYGDTGLVFDKVNSGWRPTQVNDGTSNSSIVSKHLTAQACDIGDNEDRILARWCLANRDVLARLGLYMEDPRWTPTWVHVQWISPGSGNRVYIPSTNSPKTAALSKWKRGDDLRLEVT